jgi:hypothetical protein
MPSLLQDATGLKRGSTLAREAELGAAKREASKPFYKAAEASTADLDDFGTKYLTGDDPLAEAMRKAAKAGNTIARAEAAMNTGTFNNIEPLNFVEVDGVGWQVEGRVTVGMLDAIKKGVQAVAEGTSETGNGPIMASLLRARIREMLGELDVRVPEYGKARKTFFDGSELERSMETGDAMVNRNPEDLAFQIRDMTPGNLGEVQQAFLNDLVTKYGNRSGAPDGLPPDEVARISAVFGDDAAKSITQKFDEYTTGVTKQGDEYTAGVAKQKAEYDALAITQRASFDAEAARLQQEYATAAKAQQDEYVAAIAARDEAVRARKARSQEGKTASKDLYDREVEIREAAVVAQRKAYAAATAKQKQDFREATAAQWHQLHGGKLVPAGLSRQRTRPCRVRVDWPDQERCR